MDIVWSATARRDRDTIHAYIARTRTAIDAYDWLSRINRAVLDIADYPAWGRVIDDLGNRDRVVAGPKPRYIVRYRYQPRVQRIRVVGIFHGTQRRSSRVEPAPSA